MPMITRPSAFHSLVRRSLRRLLCTALSATLAFHPLMQAGAQGIAGDGGPNAPNVGSAANGVPLVDITAPNQRGLSHNTYRDFNVDQRGVILNNSPTVGQSELGGIINGNPNLANGRSATVILNEVTSANRSRLGGFTEVHGQAADVLVVNPNGITCDGCGFINTPRATLSTGRPMIDGDGALSGLDVNGGDVLVTGQGADARRIDAFDIVSRKVVIEAPVEAGGSITIIAGRNEVGYADRSATAKADDGSEKPDVAIDSRALGGMYAGRIRLLSTEKGVGVAMRSDMAAHAGELQLTADGKIVLGRSASAGDTKITSHSSDVVVEGQIDAGGKAVVEAKKGTAGVAQGATVTGDAGVTVTARDIANEGRIQSQNTIDLEAERSIRNTDTVIANLRVTASAEQVSNSGAIQSNGLLSLTGRSSTDNSGSLFATDSLSLNVGDFINTGSMLSERSVSLFGSSLYNTASGSIQTHGALRFDLTGRFANAGLIETLDALSLQAQGIDNAASAILRANGILTLLSGKGFSNAGLISALADLNVTAEGSIDNSGRMLSGGNLYLRGTDTSNSGLIQADGTLALNAASLTNTATGSIQSAGSLSAILSDFFQNAGLWETLGSLSIEAASVDNEATGTLRANGSTTLSSRSHIANAGAITGVEGLSALAQSTVSNSGSLLSGDALRIEGTDIANSGRLLADGSLSLNGTSLTNSASGSIQSAGSLSAILSGFFRNAGLWETLGSLSIEASSFDNEATGTLRANGTTTLSSRSHITNAGTITGVEGLSASAQSTVSNSGSMLSGGILRIEGTELANSGRLLADGSLSLNGTSLTNSAGASIQSGGDLTVTLSAALANAGLIETAAALVLQASGIDNQATATMRSSATATLSAEGTFANQGIISGFTGVSARGSTLGNTGTMLSGSNLALTATNGALVNSGSLLADGRLDLSGADLINSGRIQTLGGIVATLWGALTNTGSLETAGNLSITSTEANNGKDALIRAEGSAKIAATNGFANLGLLYGGNGFTLSTEQTFTNRGTILGDGSIRIEANSLSNALDENDDGGMVLALGDLTLAVDGNITNDEALLMAGDSLFITGRTGERAGTVLNSSGLIEASGGDLIINAATVENRRTYWAMVQEAGSLDEIYTPIGTNGGNGKGDKYYVFKIINPIYGTEEYHSGQQSENKTMYLWLRDEVQRLSDDSTVAGVISAGRDLHINAFDVINTASEIVAGRDLSIVADRVTNEGTALYHIYYGNANWYWPSGERCWTETGNPCVVINGNYKENEIGRIETDEAKGLILAGGNVSITASERFGNGVDRQGASQNGGTHQDFLTVLGQTAEERQVNATNSGASGVNHEGGASGSVDYAGGTEGRVSYSTQAGGATIPGVPAGFLNQAALFKPAEPSSPYLYESRKEFTVLGNFYGSDYFLDSVGYDPDVMLKRLGDAYFDTRLIREQILKQAGMRWLDETVADDAAQMKWLLDNGATASRDLQLTVGVALTAEQQKALSSDIVWYVSEIIDGEEVLVPRLYLSQATLARAGAASGVVAGGDMTIIAGEIDNSDAIRSSGSLYLEGTSAITNNGGSIEAGGDLTMVSLGTISNLSQTAGFTSAQGSGSFVSSLASITSGGSMVVSAGGDLVASGASFVSGGDATLMASGSIDLGAARTDNSYADGGRHGSINRDSVTHIGSSVGAEGDLTIAAGKDLTIAGSGVFAGGDATLSGKESVTITSVTDEMQMRIKENDHSGMGRSTTDTRTSGTTEVGSIIASGGDLAIVSGGDVGIRASGIMGGGDVLIAAGAGADGRADASVTIEAGTDTSFFEQKTKSSGISVGGGSIGYSSSKSTTGQNGTTTVGSQVSAGGDLTILASQDINVSGSQVMAGNDALLSAGRDVNITTAEESMNSWQESKSSGVGIGFNGASVFAGINKSASDVRADGSYSVGSEIAAGNNLIIDAGRDANVHGSWLSAGQDIGISGETVSIIATDNRQTTRESHSQSNFGVTVGLNGALGNAITTGYENGVRAGQVQDGRLKGALAGQAAYKAYKGIEAANTDVSSSVGLSVSVGGSSSKSERSTSETWATGSNVEAGRDIAITARGGEDRAGNLTIIGSDITAGRDILLAAKDDIHIDAARENSSVTGSNKSSGGSIGASIGSEGATYTLSGNVGRGREQGSGTGWRESIVSAGDTLTIVSGGDTSIIGSQVGGNTVLANIGGDLNVESLQDTNSYHSKQTSAGGSVSAGAGGGGSATLNQTKIDHEFRSVSEQAGIYAGEGGFDITVGGNTDLTGAVIASDAESERNRLDTGTLTWSDLQNESRTSGTSIGGTIGYGANPDAPRDASMITGIDIAPGVRDKESGTTSSAIAEGTLTIRDEENQRQDLASLSRDTDTANAGALQDTFDRRKIEEQMEAAKIISSTGMQIVRDVANAQMEDARKKQEAAKKAEREGNHELAAQLRDEAAAIESLWGDTGAARLAGHALIGALAADTAGGSALAGAGGAITGPLIADLLADELKDLPQAARDALITAAATAAGAAVGGADGAAMANSEVKNNYLTSEQIREREQLLAEAETEEEKERIKEEYRQLYLEQKQEFSVCSVAAECRSNYQQVTSDLEQLIADRDQLTQDMRNGKISMEDYYIQSSLYADSIRDATATLESAWASFRNTVPGSEWTQAEWDKLRDDMLMVSPLGRLSLKVSPSTALKNTSLPSEPIEVLPAGAAPNAPPGFTMVADPKTGAIGYRGSDGKLYTRAQVEIMTASNGGAIDNILKPGGQIIGSVNKGASVNIRTVSTSDFQKLQADLMAMGATPSTSGPPNYVGIWYELPNGQGSFGIRTSVKNGTTIDFNISGYPSDFKVHQK